MRILINFNVNPGAWKISNSLDAINGRSAKKVRVSLSAAFLAPILRSNHNSKALITTTTRHSKTTSINDPLVNRHFKNS